MRCLHQIPPLRAQGTLQKRRHEEHKSQRGGRTLRQQGALNQHEGSSHKTEVHAQAWPAQPCPRSYTYMLQLLDGFLWDSQHVSEWGHLLDLLLGALPSVCFVQFLCVIFVFPYYIPLYPILVYLLLSLRCLFSNERQKGADLDRRGSGGE